MSRTDGGHRPSVMEKEHRDPRPQQGILPFKSFTAGLCGKLYPFYDPNCKANPPNAATQKVPDTYWGHRNFGVIPEIPVNRSAESPAERAAWMLRLHQC